ncbi:zinc metalloproteinase nas-7-like [Artemia franciscana]|uniref:zinc metalloproteinase nas-7-like n=1 Tax=Artemia franciscana TaxID=6661 RepID=UPI0032DB0236
MVTFCGKDKSSPILGSGAHRVPCFVVVVSMLEEPTSSWGRGCGNTGPRSTKLWDYAKGMRLFIPPWLNISMFLSSLKILNFLSQIGRIGNVQVVNLQTPECSYCGSCVLYTGTPIHELMHAIGFYHEQSRWDRDDYVTIFEENIDADFLYAFNKYDEDRITAFGQPYDWSSVMHYSEYAFSNNGEPTIVSKPEGIPLGNNEGLTDVDAAKINAMYNC